MLTAKTRLNDFLENTHKVLPFKKIPQRFELFRPRNQPISIYRGHFVNAFFLFSLWVLQKVLFCLNEKWLGCHGRYIRTQLGCFLQAFAPEFALVGKNKTALFRATFYLLRTCAMYIFILLLNTDILPKFNIILWILSLFLSGMFSTIIVPISIILLKA